LSIYQIIYLKKTRRKDSAIFAIMNNLRLFCILYFPILIFLFVATACCTTKSEKAEKAGWTLVRKENSDGDTFDAKISRQVQPLFFHPIQRKKKPAKRIFA
jgi:hypothetical protein